MYAYDKSNNVVEIATDPGTQPNIVSDRLLLGPVHVNYPSLNANFNDPQH